ncbi:UBN2_2 domain-containing protein, partial [Cephalotus follicularis]
DLWGVLKEAFSQASEAQEFELHSKMQYHFKTTSMTTIDYLNGFKAIFDQLNAIGKPIADQKKFFILLSNLGPAYESFATTGSKLHLHNRSYRPETPNSTMAFYSHTNTKDRKCGVVKLALFLLWVEASHKPHHETNKLVNKKKRRKVIVERVI